jgi:hypothetical protein
MSTINYLTVRNTVLPVVNAVTMNYSTLTGSTITATSLNLTSANVALGASTNQTYNNFSSGSYAPVSWVTAKSALSSTNKTVMSANGQYQMIVGNATSGLFLSSDSGITWTALTGGLPTLTGSAYWSDGAISANGQYITLSIYGGSLWMSADYGRTFALTNQPTPSIWLQLNGNVTDLMGSSTVTATGSPGYVTLNYPGYTAQAVNLLNTAGGTATRYIRGTWPGAANFTVSLWFNAQSVNGTLQPIFEAYFSGLGIFIGTNNFIYFQFPNGGAGGNTQLLTSFTVSVNTWYYVTGMFQTNGLCSFYVNNTLIASSTNTGGVGTITSSGSFGLGTFDTVTTNAFNGYVDDIRITNSVSTYVPIPLLQPNIWMPFENTAGDLGSYSLAPGATPAIYLPFEGNLTDSMGFTTVTPSTPAPTYVAGYIGQALRLTNPPGGTAAQYVRGTWTSPSIYTVSGWFNLQTSTGTGNQFIFSTGGTSGPNAVILYINTNTQLAAQVPNGVTIVAPVTISLSTWYSFTLKVYPSGGQCSLYLNNSIYTAAATATATPSGTFGLGTFDSGTATNAFNGIIDDFRITNFDVPLSVVSVTGSLSYVPGVVGLNAVNLVNTAGGTATNYIRSVWTGAPNITVSGWVNFQSYNGSSNNSIMFSAYTAAMTIYTDTTGKISAYIPTGGASSGTLLASTTNQVSLNTWYHVYFIFQTGGLCSLYVNGSLIGSATNTGGVGAFTTSVFSLGTYDHLLTNAFNGYIDDLRIYNAAIPYHVLFPQNYRSLALSGTGQYTLASAASGWVVGSSDSSKTWSKQAVTVGTQSDIIQPNMTNLAATGTALTTSPWIMNGVTWIASSSSINNSTTPVSYAFNNTSSNEWVPLSATYTTAGNSSGQSTMIQNSIGAVTGEWLQIQSSVPLIMSSYQFATGNVVARTPKTYYIVGSNDGTTWYAIQYGAAGAVTTTASFTIVPNTIIVNNASTQTFGSSTITTTTYATTTNAYTYFRLICLSNYSGSNDVVSLGEWIINFFNPLTNSRPSPSPLSLNYTGQYQLVATGPATGSIIPNQTGLAAATWSQGGVNWRVSASTTLTGGIYESYQMFDNNYSTRWVALSNTYSTSGNTSGVSNTIIGIVGTQTGDWLQIQSSVPLVMTSYQFASGYFTTRLPKTYYITGSNDGSNWYPVQYVSGGTVTTTASNTLVPGVILINSTSAQTFGSSTVATTAYSTSTNAYTYFRLVCLTSYSGSADYLDIGEWIINFSNSVSYSSNYGSTWLNTSSTVSNESVALSPSGQYALSTNSVTPFARLTLDNTNVDAQCVLVPATGAGTSYSTSTKVVGTHSAFFNNAAGPNTPSNYLNYTVPAVLNAPSMLTMACWMYPTSIVVNITPMAICSGGGYGNHFYINPSGINFYWASTVTNAGTGLTSTTTAPLNTWTHICMTYNGTVLSLYVNGIIVASTNVTGRLCLAGGGNLTNVLIGSAVTTANAFAGNVDDVRIYTSALSAHEVASLYANPALTQTIAVSNSYLPITGYTKPILPGITANVVDTAVSQTGQYMVAVTSSITNNVYYSTDYGATFTALTIGSSAMVSCSISYDGSYLTVTSATTTYTLNRNTRGFTLAVGSQAGAANQAQNAIAIGNKAGQTNQSANSIVLNASGNALDAVVPGFYVSPIATAASSSAAPFSLLGYGTDNQVVQSSALMVLQNGNVGIGTTNPAYTFHVIGAIFATGNVTAFSDQRYKQNIVRLDRSLDAIRSLSGYSYTREDYQPGVRQIGLLAQEVKKIIPEAVSYDSINDIYSVNYNCLIAPVVESIKELYDRSEVQKQIIQDQQATIQKLIDRLGL